MVKGRFKSVCLSFIIVVIAIGGIAGYAFVKQNKNEDVEKIANQEEVITNENIEEVYIEEEIITNEEMISIENYVNEICNNYYTSGRIPQFDKIENADKNWIYAHIKAEEKIRNPKFEYNYMSSYASKESIENNLKNLFGENYDINLERDNEYIENNMFAFNEQVGKYELLPTGDISNICYVINTIKKVNEEYIVNVVECVVTSDYNEQYGNLGDYNLIETFNDYDKSKSLIENGKEIFHIECSKIYSSSASNASQALNTDKLKEEVLKRKNEFLAYNITIEKSKNGNFIVQKIESAGINN